MGAYRFMASAIPDHAKFLAPLHKAIGKKLKLSPIEWTEDLISAFKTAQKSLTIGQPLTQPKEGEQL